MADEIERDNERHRREEKERRAKRQKSRDAKAKPGGQSEKERKRREHAQRVLGAQHAAKQKPAAPRGPPSAGGASHRASAAGSAATAVGGASVFQSLFHERAEGFFIDLRFRNAPPRPPVGPAFVGLGLEGELTDQWTQYKPRNAVEDAYTWKLHPEPDLGVPLAASAMDYEGCYRDPAKRDAAGKDKEGGGDNPDGAPPSVAALHPDDAALIDWTGSLGDTAAEQLQQKQDRVRAAARLAIAQGAGAMPSQRDPGGVPPPPPAAAGSAVRLKKHHTQSRLLDEQLPHFMKKTTYITNDTTSVHRFTSLAKSQSRRARDVDRALAATRTMNTETSGIERGFAAASNTGGRTHPSKQGLTPVWDLPLLPDVGMWASTHTHVVVDHPPRNVENQGPAAAKGGPGEDATRLLRRAIVADVTKQTQNARMECTVWAPKEAPAPADPKSPAPPPAPSRRGALYSALQRYDLDIVPLRDPSAPPVHYVLAVDPARGRAGYHPVGSRVQLSTGRPAAVADSRVARRPRRAADVRDRARRTAEVDRDAAGRDGAADAGDGAGGGAARKKAKPAPRVAAEDSASASASDSEDEAEGDAF